MNSLPPSFNSATFNSSAFSGGQYITRADANRLYLPITAGANLNLIYGITPGVAAASKAMILDSSRNITNVNSITSALGAYSSTAGGDMLVLTTTATNARNSIKFVTDTQSWEIGSRGSTAQNPNTLYMYNGAYRLTMNPSGDTSFLSTTESSSSTTGCLILSGGLGVAKNINAAGIVTVTRNGSHLSLVNGGSSGLIEVSASPAILRLVNGFAANIGSLGLRLENGSAAAARYPLDFGNVAADLQIVLNQTTAGSTSAYGFGANNSALESHSGGDWNWHSGTTQNGSLGIKRMSLSSTGNILATGAHFTGFSPTGPTGPGIKIHYGGSFGQVFSYNYTTATALNSTFGFANGGNYHLVCTTNTSSAFVNVNSQNQTGVCPLAVYGSGSFTRSSGNYGWLTSSGAGNVVGASFTRDFSIYSENGILVQTGEIDVFSDLRKKHSVQDLSTDLVERFIEKIKPISYVYKKGPQSTRYGYSAQEMVSHKFMNIVGITDTHGDDLGNEDIVCDDGSVFHLPSDCALSINVVSIIPILHRAIQLQQEQLLQQRVDIDRLLELIKKKDRSD